MSNSTDLLLKHVSMKSICLVCSNWVCTFLLLFLTKYSESKRNNFLIQVHFLLSSTRRTPVCFLYAVTLFILRLHEITVCNVLITLEEEGTNGNAG